MSSALYVFRLVWPFLKELVLGGTTLKEGIKSQKKRVVLLFLISGLIFMVFLGAPRLYQLSQEIAKLEKSHEAKNVARLEARIRELEDILRLTNGPTYVAPTSGTVKDPPLPPAPKDQVVAVVDTPTTNPSPPPKQSPAPANPKRPSGDATDRKKSYMQFFDTQDD